MALLISTPTSLSSTSSSTRVAAIYQLSSSFSSHKNSKFSLSSWISHLGIAPFSQWSGLKHLGVSLMPKFLSKERKRRCKSMVVHASLFGVGAPEALVIGVVALLVFGPKGLAEVARNLGKTLRAFQPTIRELQDVSREFKTTLEREIGLDDIPSQRENMYSSNRANIASAPSSPASNENSPTEADPNGAPSQTTAYTSEEYLKITEEQLKASAAQQQVQTPASGESQFESRSEPQVTIRETAGAKPPPQKPENEE
ncbi:conserved hypothetical protein [Ricinus communis]|uniref:Sec-independent protein translocase protein TATB, chloroplastic n=1 Tax=Ricinus communis TaxID=3988 RepID=B9RIV4_RICCO|nr:conserved hypothetical protein [Ricinus communis]|eukprot:XP_002513673.1 sec-independent protein translocase protein TATB, chloroplastic [Ricinus communis]